MAKSKVRRKQWSRSGTPLTKAELRAKAREVGRPILTISFCENGCGRDFYYYNDAVVLPECPECGAPWQ
jgi:hypothetical protein